jgi:hypothetical protein
VALQVPLTLNLGGVQLEISEEFVAYAREQGIAVHVWSAARRHPHRGGGAAADAVACPSPIEDRHVRRRATTAVTALALLAAACSPDGDDPEVTVSDDEVAAAAEEAGCRVAQDDEEFDTTHLDPAEAPSAAELYADRPAVGGPHFAEWLSAGVFDAPVEERAAVHNLEHGAVAVYHDPDLDDAELAELHDWANERNAAGLLDERTGAGLLVAPWEGQLVPPIAFRAWGVSADCESFDATFGDGLVRDHFGTAGDAPEGTLGTDPTEVIGAADAEG